MNQPFCHAASDHSLEELAQQIAIAEAVMEKVEIGANAVAVAN